ncbi:aliphatic sulfonate ABC transporter substrate-binding protein [Acetobacter sp.]|uniref:aliphatic sulfonate ABC transporter substrate-binding protein n=1 Tax=Acetobacter sp. TaxID=440 RepID=UPI0039E82F11
MGKLALTQGVVALLGRTAMAQGRVVSIGYQKYGTLILLKEKGFLEEALKPKGVSVQWAQFPAGPPLLQALIGGTLDFGGTGDLPPVFAQASSPDALVYAGNETPTGSSEAIIVPDTSPIRTVRDLRGKRVAVTRGSDAHWLLLASLKNNGLSFKDIEVSYLLPAAARPAFEAGKVDAWSIWDPYLSGVSTPVRSLATGSDCGGGTQFYLARKGFFTDNLDLLHDVIAAVTRCDAWAQANKPDVVKILARSTGLDPAVVARSVEKIEFGFHYITPQVIAQQQHIADTFAAEGLLPSTPKVSDAAPKI